MIEFITKHYEKKRERSIKKMSYRCGPYAEDAVQEAYYRALKYADSYEAGKDFDKWFNRILYCASAEFRRFNQGLPLDTVPEEDLPMVEDEGFDERMKFEVGQDIERITDEQAKEIVSLHFVMGFKPYEVVQITGESRRNVYYHISEFKKYIMEKYG